MEMHLRAHFTKARSFANKEEVFLGKPGRARSSVGVMIKARGTATALCNVPPSKIGSCYSRQ